MLVMQQERVTLRYGDDFVTFDWPFGQDLVTVTNAIGQPTAMSVQEAHDLFWTLLDGGAY